MAASYIWGILGDENVPMLVAEDDLRNHPHLAYDVAEFEDDIEKSASSEITDKPF